MKTYQELMIESEMSASEFNARKDAVNNGFWRVWTWDMTFDAPITYQKLVKLEQAGLTLEELHKSILRGNLRVNNLNELQLGCILGVTS